MLAVTDNGCGMSEDVVERIFEPFFTTKQLGKGTGLGLSTVFGIVRQAAGTIRVKSKPGEGTTFRVYWPRADEAARERLAAVARVPRGSETILVAEDEDSIRHLTHRILEERGYTVLSAPNGTQAIETAQAHAGPIHLLITDVIMPDMNGVRLAQTLAAMRPDTKVLYLSGYTSDVIADRGVLREGVEFIQKPFSGETLARRTREVLDKKRPTSS
jgi:two-component system cell cycle sensor histidine kinase/response regulator CckA